MEYMRYGACTVPALLGRRCVFSGDEITPGECVVYWYSFSNQHRMCSLTIECVLFLERVLFIGTPSVTNTACLRVSMCVFDVSVRERFRVLVQY